MLSFCTGTGEIVARGGGTLPREVVWVDLLKPEPDEVEEVERVTGLRVPTLAELSEIETSSRLQIEKGILYLSAPLVYRADTDAPTTTPVGFVLSPERLLTVRFEPLTSFEAFARSLHEPSTSCTDATEAFAGLMEAIVDRIADILEGIASELDHLSHRAFHAGPIQGRHGRHRGRDEADLRRLLRRVGGNGDISSKIRDSLLGVGRVVPFVAAHAADRMDAELKARFETIRLDVLSLNDYDAYLINKVQLLLDTTLGLINIEQNNIIKVLTVVSVVGVPPTLVASIYGMNFKAMPELDWALGYPYALAMIVLSAILPLLWFKVRGWF
jgi:magnesium transporter